MALFFAAGWCGAAGAQSAPGSPEAPPTPPPAALAAPMAAKDAPIVDGNVTPAACATCGGVLHGGTAGCSSGCCGSGCYPGRDLDYCCGWEANTTIGRFFSDLYCCICCPDPCYEPRWLPLADAAFFVDAARPVTQTRFRWDTGWNLEHPDRAEYFWARVKTDPAQVAPPGSPTGAAKGPSFIAKNVDYSQLFLGMEAATGRFSILIEQSYRDLDPDTAIASIIDPTASTPGNVVFRTGDAGQARHSSGFGDMSITTKTLLLDCELLQFSFLFRTSIPVGSAPKGLGIGHVALEPSLAYSLRMTPSCYMQGQIAYWIPIGGDPLYQGNIFHAHWSFNHVLWAPTPGLQLIGTLEFNEWSVLGGNYTEPDYLVPADSGFAPLAQSASTTIFSIGPGIRLFVCDKLDIGVGSAFAVTGPRWAKDLVRAELRLRF
jgi:hypothetical protein